MSRKREREGGRERDNVSEGEIVCMCVLERERDYVCV